MQSMLNKSMASWKSIYTTSASPDQPADASDMESTGYSSKESTFLMPPG